MLSAPIPFMPRTKLRPPRLPDDLLSRPSLLEKLNRTETLTLVIAPAGYGKTTLVGTWVAHCNRPYAWISLDPEDNTFIGFVAAIVLAMQRVFPAFGGELLELLAKEAVDVSPESIMPLLLNALDTVDCPFVLVFDDYHVISDTAVHQVLWWLLASPPRPMHLVLTARYDPPIPARIRLQGTVNEIRAGALRFGTVEIQAFLAQFTKQPPETQDVANFCEQAEGWAVSMRLLGVMMHQQGLASVGGALRKCSGYLLEYLEAEVIGGLDANTQTFLTRTSILKRLSAELCDVAAGELLPGLDSAAMLQMLADKGIFVEPLDDSGEWFRYHELFRILLKHRLYQTEGERAVEQLEARIGYWCERHGVAEATGGASEHRTPAAKSQAESGVEPLTEKQAPPMAPAVALPWRIPIAKPPPSPKINRDDLLTFREMDVMELLNQRLTNKEIAHKLGISYETVRQHTVNIYRKLGVENRRQAIVQATAWGITTGTEAAVRLPSPR
jgi:LuxR family transcriptional regulator, maltose regulon positive regulatory protein